MANPSIIKKLVVTDKATDLNKFNQYVFMVTRSATKPEVRKAIKEIYRVDVERVNIIHRRPKLKRFRGLRGAQQGYKKAVVTVKSGQKINTGR